MVLLYLLLSPLLYLLLLFCICCCCSVSAAVSAAAVVLYLLLSPLLSNHWLLLEHVNWGFSSMRDTAFNTKTTVKNCPKTGDLEFVVVKASERSVMTTL